VRTATLLQNRANDIRQHQLQQRAITEKLILETSVGFTGAGSCVGANRNASDHEGGSPRTTISSHSRFARGITRYPARNQKLHNAHPLPEGDLATLVKCVANTPDCVLETPRKHNDRPALQNTRILQTHIRQTRHGTIPPATQLQNHSETFAVTFLTQTTVMSTTLTTGTLETPWTTCTYTFYLKSDYNDDYYSDDGNSGDLDVDNLYRHFFLNQTTVISTTLTTSTLETPTLTIMTLFAISLASVLVDHALHFFGAFHHGISSQPWQ
jgi:hypothetical protein